MSLLNKQIQQLQRSLGLTDEQVKELSSAVAELVRTECSDIRETAQTAIDSFKAFNISEALKDIYEAAQQTAKANDAGKSDGQQAPQSNKYTVQFKPNALELIGEYNLHAQFKSLTEYLETVFTESAPSPGLCGNEIHRLVKTVLTTFYPDEVWNVHVLMTGNTAVVDIEAEQSAEELDYDIPSWITGGPDADQDDNALDLVAIATEAAIDALGYVDASTVDDLTNSALLITLEPSQLESASEIEAREYITTRIVQSVVAAIKQYPGAVDKIQLNVDNIHIVNHDGKPNLLLPVDITGIVARLNKLPV